MKKLISQLNSSAQSQLFLTHAASMLLKPVVALLVDFGDESLKYFLLNSIMCKKETKKKHFNNLKDWNAAHLCKTNSIGFVKGDRTDEPDCKNILNCCFYSQLLLLALELSSLDDILRHQQQPINGTR